MKSRKYAPSPLLAGLIGLLLTLAATLPATAQVFPRGNGIAFSGIKQFDLYVEIGGWNGMPADQIEFRLGAQRLFEEGLGKVEVRRRPADRNYLVCNVQATRTEGLVAYATRLEFWGMKSTDVHTLLWENGSLSTVPAERFDEDLVANECLQYFIDEWIKWNRS